MEEKDINKIVEQLDSINCRLETIAHFLNEINTYGIINPDLTNAVIAIARATSKDYDKECKELEGKLETC